ncbi:hypothetical protein L1049_015411 [Liquidambar formosana]|uniref:Transmembrane protein n=1 Tax=Liquidambar formosana TaxID=63359 RepID=A0AAP0X642_LIQFO
MAKEFNVPPVVFPFGGNPATSTQQCRLPIAPFQPPRPAKPRIPFMSFDIGSVAASTSFSTPQFGGPPVGISVNFDDEPPLLEELGEEHSENNGFITEHSISDRWEWRERYYGPSEQRNGSIDGDVRQSEAKPEPGKEIVETSSYQEGPSMGYYGRRRSTASSIFDVFTLNPLPYPVLLILAVIFIFLGLSWFTSYESVVETAEVQMGWVLIAAPIVLLILVRWLSSMESPERFFWRSPYDRRYRTHYQPSEGSSPWGVAALIVLLLVLLQYQSSFLKSWFV